MTELSLLDQMFYKFEQGGMSTQYMIGASIFDPTTSPYPLDGKMLADHIIARLETVPMLRKKFVQDPLRIGNMRLVDDGGFDIRDHISTLEIATARRRQGALRVSHRLCGLATRFVEATVAL